MDPQVLPLLLALLGPALHICESGARTVVAPPPEQHIKDGGYTEWLVEPTAALCFG